MQFLVFISFVAVLRDVLADPLDAAGQQACVSEHNKYRSELALGNVKNGAGQTMQKATDMNQLKYDKELEAKAQDWAKDCKNKMVHTPNIKYGQNLFWSSETLDHATAMKQATAGWWDEVKLLDSTDVVLTMEMFNKQVGHFTEMAQSKNTGVGCAITTLCGGTYVVCNYDAPNMLNGPIYKTGGEPCTSCDPSRKSCRKGLCLSCAKKNKK
ncbi:hypothetical protein M3Y94_00061800 [Aphelenchoides besseyi]|nr:hypothetical protein M3Y94_00061800 [Aphelenchoides besseyi]KAI6237941.1 Venom allergen-like protein [Aphelenchoides besseyi]